MQKITKSDQFLNQKCVKKIKEIDEMMSVGAPIAPIGGGSFNLKNRYPQTTNNQSKLKKKIDKNEFEKLLEKEIEKNKKDI